ncbi:uncharacterized protein LOC119662386 [Teleopsis dalmanni]|uniref:uncharacterized protein LOC119662386 n=1 Tax=Teleopsis dalmanni TaxID=139649 RepID=UPI000D32B9F1|nr:uncharacterized protein LOC119662386 [Teleopsis dalmanni]
MSSKIIYFALVLILFAQIGISRRTSDSSQESEESKTEVNVKIAIKNNLNDNDSSSESDSEELKLEEEVQIEIFNRLFSDLIDFANLTVEDTKVLLTQTLIDITKTTEKSEEVDKHFKVFSDFLEKAEQSKTITSPYKQKRYLIELASSIPSMFIRYDTKTTNKFTVEEALIHLALLKNGFTVYEDNYYNRLKVCMEKIEEKVQLHISKHSNEDKQKVEFREWYEKFNNEKDADAKYQIVLEFFK